MRRIRKFLGKKVSLMMVGSSRDKLRQLQISYGVILGICFALTFFFTSNVLLTTSYVGNQVSIHEAERLAMENKHLTKKFKQLRSEIDEIANRYAELVSKEIVIRNIFNLPEISTDERKLGIGGPDNITHNKLSTALQVAHSTESEIDALLRLANFEIQMYEDVHQELQGKKELLDHTPSIRPTRGYHTRGFGMKHDPFTGYKRFHGGLDIASRIGTPIYATADGIVETIDIVSDLGKYIIIDHGFGYKTIYGHLSEFKTKTGQTIRRGDLIALMGNTGYSTGPHLHYEVLKNNQRVNPVTFILD